MAGHREGDAVVFAENLQRLLAVVVRGKRGEVAIHQCADLRLRRREQEAAHADIIEQATGLVGHIDHVERLAIVAMGADVIERLAHGPVGAHGDIVERHHPADTVLRVGQQILGDLALLGRKQRDQLHGEIERQAVKEGRAVVWRQIVQQGGGLGLRERLQQLVFCVVLQIGEYRRRQLRRAPAEKRGQLLHRQLGQQRRRIGRQPRCQHCLQAREILVRQERGDLGLDAGLGGNRFNIGVPLSLATGETLCAWTRRAGGPYLPHE